MSVKATIFIILVCALAFALHLIIVKLLLDCVCEISKITTTLINTDNKTDDGKQHFYYRTPDGDILDLCGGCDAKIWETEQGQKTLEEVYNRINNIGGCGATEPWDKGYDDGITAALGKIEEMMI